MSSSAGQNKVAQGVALAVLATLIWSGNFVVARGVADLISPVSLAFFRWFTACVILFPIAFRQFHKEKHIAERHVKYFFWTALSGVTLFNTFVYVAGHYSPALNLALIGTTSSPIMAIILAAIFLQEKITLARIVGLIICISGIGLLISGGSLMRLLSFRFSPGDWWVLAGALCFAVYNTFVKRKPSGISALTFLFVVFTFGTVLLLPAFVVEQFFVQSVQWSFNLVLIVLYLGAGTSVISFLCWNAAIARLGSSRTALFGNLIPIFSAIEAVIFLNEKITTIHAVSGILVIAGLIIANLFTAKKTTVLPTEMAEKE